MRYLVWLQVILLSGTLSGQQLQAGPYQLTLKRELGITLVGAGAAAGGYFLNHATDDVLLRDLELPGVPPFDGSALRHDSDGAATASDIVAYGSLVMPALLLADQRMAKDARTLAVLFAETILLNQGFTDIVKGTVKRPRPYLYEGGLAPDLAVTAYDRSSFLSNHTSTTAAASFFVARVFADYHPESELRTYVWIASATLPALGGYLRVRAGQHFPSDVVAGYGLGAIIGYGVPLLHRKGGAERRWTVVPGGSGILLTVRLG
ncbi:membrane-associated phospholipid phosphatase [Neolewinella xylanilytica]|uniref:Membrane-associated phospholipid phosphatase n=1 Tax=Neolewinella xylanilytica TaxID=1514080 RepID=A0A2S6IB59_9BACT|nr:membrane-associated phospholipid phosphatase [Neolewinella xylanilytica]